MKAFLLIVAMMLAVLLYGCDNKGDFCDLYEPVVTSHSDTDQTVSQVKINEATYKRLCE